MGQNNCCGSFVPKPIWPSVMVRKSECFSRWDHSLGIWPSYNNPKFTISFFRCRMMIWSWDNDAMLHLAGFPDKVKRWGCWGTHRLSALFSVIEVSSSHLRKHAPSPPTCYTTYTTNTNCTQHIHIQYIVPNWNGAQRLGPIYILIWKAELEQFPFHRIPQLMKVLFGNLLDFERNQSGEKSFFCRIFQGSTHDRGF